MVSVRSGEGVFQELGSKKIFVRRDDGFQEVTTPIKVVRRGRGGGGGGSSGAPPLETEQERIKREQKVKEIEAKAAKEALEKAKEAAETKREAAEQRFSRSVAGQLSGDKNEIDVFSRNVNNRADKPIFLPNNFFLEEGSVGFGTLPSPGGKLTEEEALRQGSDIVRGTVEDGGTTASFTNLFQTEDTSVEIVLPDPTPVKTPSTSTRVRQDVGLEGGQFIDPTLGKVEPLATEAPDLSDLISIKRDELFTKSSRRGGASVGIATAQFGLGVGSSVLGTLEFGAAAITRPLDTLGGILTTVTSPRLIKEQLGTIGRTIRNEPAFALGFAVGEVAQIKGFDLIGGKVGIGRTTKAPRGRIKEGRIQFADDFLTKADDLTGTPKGTRQLRVIQTQDDILADLAKGVKAQEAQRGISLKGQKLKQEFLTEVDKRIAKSLDNLDDLGPQIRVTELEGKKVVSLKEPSSVIPDQFASFRLQLEKELGRLDDLFDPRLRVIDEGRPVKTKLSKPERAAAIDDLGKSFEQSFTGDKMFKLETTPKPPKSSRLQQKQILRELESDIKLANIEDFSKFESDILIKRRAKALRSEFETFLDKKNFVPSLEVVSGTPKKFKVIDLGTSDLAKGIKSKPFTPAKASFNPLIEAPSKSGQVLLQQPVLKDQFKTVQAPKTKPKLQTQFKTQIQAQQFRSKPLKTVKASSSLEKSLVSDLGKGISASKSLSRFASDNLQGFGSLNLFRQAKATPGLSAFGSALAPASILPEVLLPKQKLKGLNFRAFDDPTRIKKKRKINDRDRRKKSKKLRRNTLSKQNLGVSLTGSVLGIRGGPKILSPRLGVDPFSIRGIDTRKSKKRVKRRSNKLTDL